MTSIKKFSLALIMLTASQYGFGAEESQKATIERAVNNKNLADLQAALDDLIAPSDTLGNVNLLSPQQQIQPPQAPRPRTRLSPQSLQSALTELANQDNSYQQFLTAVTTHDANVMDTSQ